MRYLIDLNAGFQSKSVLKTINSHNSLKNTKKITIRLTFATSSVKSTNATFNRTNASYQAVLVFNEDLMTMLMSFKVIILSLNKAHTELQTLQYNDFKTDFLGVLNQILELIG